jgi:alkylation response protein AidB-like acyl-CoA dehydrogenase
MTERPQASTIATSRSDPTTPGLLASARELAPLFEARADANEDAEVLADEVVATFWEHGLLGLWVPRELGGAELGAVDAVAVLEEVSRADASTGWVLMAAALATATGAVYLEDEAVAGLFGGDRLPLIAGQGSFPNGTAAADGHGFRLSGHWSYGSGVRHADHLHSAAVVQENGAPRTGPDGGPEVRIFVTPRERAELGGNWEVLGLRATASVDYSISDLSVPRAYTHVAATETPRRGGHFYTLGIPAFACICHSAWALGVGRRALDELAGYVHSRGNRPGGLAQSESFHEGFARSEADYRAARALVYETWHEIDDTLDRGEPLSTRQRTLAWLALNKTTWTVAEVCRFVYLSAGGVALRRGVIQRLFRDMYAGTQHVTSGTPVLRACGRELAGFAEGKVWLGLGQLVDPA